MRSNIVKILQEIVLRGGIALFVEKSIYFLTVIFIKLPLKGIQINMFIAVDKQIFPSIPRHTPFVFEQTVNST